MWPNIMTKPAHRRVYVRNTGKRSFTVRGMKTFNAVVVINAAESVTGVIYLQVHTDR